MKDTAKLVGEIQEWKKKRNAVILAHNYQTAAIQDLADHVGDSLILARKAAATDADVILFSGVHFMAETASILCPEKKVIVPDLEAQCTLADMISPEEIVTWRAKHPDGVVVCYVNSSALVKAESDYCCTSSNAVDVVRAIPADKPVFFVPDYYLGSYTKARLGRGNMDVWRGYCPAHAMIQNDDIQKRKKEYPNAKAVVHPECSCVLASLTAGDEVTSTEGMMRFVKSCSAKEIIVATETGILHRLEKENPDKIFIPACVEECVCTYMKMNTLEKILTALKTLQPEVKVPETLAKRARTCIQRMLEVV